MRDTKFWCIMGLMLLCAVAFFTKEPLQAPATPAQSASPSGTPNPALAGGITALKVEDERAGSGAGAKSGDVLTMNYRGKLLDGTEFDASYGREPFRFELGAGRVIKGWDEGIKGMKAGGKRRLTIPASLGYGATGSPPKIPGGATLIFEVELLKIEI